MNTGADMEKKIVKLIKFQVEKLDGPEFDLEAWKSATTSLISRFLGELDPRIKQINDLKIDYSSWALRDSNSKYNPIETCKKKGKAILETVISEIEVLGVDQPSNPLEKLTRHLSEKELKAFDKESDKAKFFSSMKKDQLVSMLTALVS